MRLQTNTLASTLLGFIALILLAPLALVLLVGLRFARSGVSATEFFAAMLFPNGAPAVFDTRSRGWKEVLDALAHARLL